MKIIYTWNGTTKTIEVKDLATALEIKELMETELNLTYKFISIAP